MTENQDEAGTARRRLLKAVTAGIGGATILPHLPSSWSRPVVESVVLPAHAQSTGVTTFAITSCSIESATDTGTDAVDIAFSFTLSRSDGQPFPAGFTMDVDFTFSPSGTTVGVLGNSPGGEFSLDGSNTYSATETVTASGIDSDSEVQMTVAFAISGLVDAGDAPPCNAGPETIVEP